eukprot:8376668-Ditylum_brightwellii.AAC.1
MDVLLYFVGGPPAEVGPLVGAVLHWWVMHELRGRGSGVSRMAYCAELVRRWSLMEADSWRGHGQNCRCHQLAVSAEDGKVGRFPVLEDGGQ